MGAKERANAALPPLLRQLPKASPGRPTRLVGFQRRATSDGSRAQELAEFLLRQCGFGDELAGEGQVPGRRRSQLRRHRRRRLRVDLRRLGRLLQLRPGLERTDTLWKALGKAAILRTQYPDDERPCRYVLLTTDMPKAGSAGYKALRAAQQDGLIWDVLRLDEPETVAELLHYASGKRSDVADRRGVHHRQRPDPAPATPAAARWVT